jgi:glycosyltransferase involved in cell wall biosynthesis
MKKILLLGVLFVFLGTAVGKSVELTIVTPTYNNEKYCIRNLKWMVKQNFTNWKMIIIDDCSTDKTKELIKEYIQTHHLSDKVLLIENSQRCGALKNIYTTVSNCDDNDIIVLYDGDDRWAHEGVLMRIAQEYSDDKVWMTYGSWQAYPTKAGGNCRALPKEIIKKAAFREYSFVTSHPRTFYAWLFKKIKLEDFLYKGEFFSVAWDLAIMFPLLEISANGHIRYIPDILYFYNIDNPLNDFKCHTELQQRLDRFIRTKSKYAAL